MAASSSVAKPDLTPRWSADLPDYVNALRFAPDGALLAAPTLAGPVAVLEAETGQVCYELAGHRGGTLAVAWSPDGRVLATGGQDGQVRLMRGNTGTLMTVLDGGGGWVEHLAWSQDGRCVAVAIGKTARFFSASGERLGEVTEHESTITALRWLPQTELVVTACYGGVQFLQAGQPQPVQRFPWKGSILSLVISPDGKYLASGNQDASVHVWRTKTGEDFQMSGYPTKVTTLAFSPNSRTLATGCGAAILLWDFKGKGPAGKKPQILKGHTGLVTDLTFIQAQGNRRLVSVARDGVLCTWAPHLSSRTVTATAADVPLERLAVDPRERMLVVASRFGRVDAFSL